MIKECQNPPHFRVISDNTALLEICNLAQMKSAVALDTEFMRVSTYFPKLGLIQLYDGERVSLIDPLAITDFSPFVALLSNPKVLKSYILVVKIYWFSYKNLISFHAQ